MDSVPIRSDILIMKLAGGRKGGRGPLRASRGLGAIGARVGAAVGAINCCKGSLHSAAARALRGGAHGRSADEEGGLPRRFAWLDELRGNHSQCDGKEVRHALVRE